MSKFVKWPCDTVRSWNFTNFCLISVTKKNPRTSPNLRTNPRKNLNLKRRFMLNLKKVPRNRRKSHQRRSKKSKNLAIHQSAKCLWLLSSDWRIIQERGLLWRLSKVNRDWSPISQEKSWVLKVNFSVSKRFWTIYFNFKLFFSQTLKSYFFLICKNSKQFIFNFFCLVCNSKKNWLSLIFFFS